VTGRRGRRRCKQLLDGLKEKREYCKLKGKALERTLWRSGFGRCYEPAARQCNDSRNNTVVKKLFLYKGHKNGYRKQKEKKLLKSWMKQDFISGADRRVKTPNKIYRSVIRVLQLRFQNVETVVVKVLKGSNRIEFKKE